MGDAEGTRSPPQAVEIATSHKCSRWATISVLFCEKKSRNSFVPSCTLAG
jgi:hypothetical protein